MVYEWGWWFFGWSTPMLVGGRGMFCVFHGLGVGVGRVEGLVEM